MSHQTRGNILLCVVGLSEKTILEERNKNNDILNVFLITHYIAALTASVQLRTKNVNA